MNCWHILDIDPTNDERAIRKAYAKKLKITRPDEDPIAYQQLREAFDHAINIAPFIDEETLDDERIEEHNENISLFSNLGNLTESELVNNKADLYVNEDEKSLEFEQPSAYADQINSYNSQDEFYYQPNRIEEIMAEIQQAYEQQGEEFLLENWQEFEQKISLLPLGQEEQFSWDLLRFFLQQEINEEKLWFICSERFHWHNDYQISQYLAPETIELLQQKVNNGKLLYEAEINLNQKLDSSMLREIPPNYYPISQAIFYRFRSFWQHILMYFYGFFLYHKIKYETSDEFWQNSDYFSRMKDFISKVKLIKRLIYLICIAIMIHKYNYFLRIYGNTLLYLVLALTPIILISLATKSFAKNVLPDNLINKLVKNKTFHFTISFIIPITAYCFFVYAYNEKNSVQLNIALFVILALCGAVFSRFYIDQIMINYYIHYFGLFLIYCYIDKTYHLDGYYDKYYFYLILLIGIVWNNIILYLFAFYHHKYQDWINKMTTLPYSKELYLHPLKAIRSALLWLFFIPILSSRHSMASVIELAYVALIVIVFSNIPVLILFFYPLVLLIYGRYYQISRTMLKKLNVNQ